MLVAFAISLLAGLATSVGGIIALGPGANRRSRFAVTLAFSAGAMLIVSLVELLPLGIASLHEQFEPRWATAVGYGAFFAGIGIVLAIDRFLPHSLNPNETEGREQEVVEGEMPQTRALLRSGLLVAFVLALHNLPEGMATFFAAYSDLTLGIPLAIAIAIHNIPEGIAVAAPVYAATGSRSKAFWWATLSGLTEPLGALIAVLLVSWVIPAAFFGVFYALVAGMMVFLALDELLPGAWRYQTDKHQTVYGMLAGMAVVALSFVLFA